MLIAAGLIIMTIGLIHSFLGERKLIRPLFQSTELSAYKRRLIRIAWHITTLFWFAISAQLFAMHFWPDKSFQSFLLIMSVTFGVSTVISLINSRGRHISWTGFGAATFLLGFVAFNS